MKKNDIYEAPLADVVLLDAVDVITASVPFDDSDTLSDGWIPA